jgi:hypothetical protein
VLPLVLPQAPQHTHLQPLPQRHLAAPGGDKLAAGLRHLALHLRQPLLQLGQACRAALALPVLQQRGPGMEHMGRQHGSSLGHG